MQRRATPETRTSIQPGLGKSTGVIPWHDLPLRNQRCRPKRSPRRSRPSHGTRCRTGSFTPSQKRHAEPSPHDWSASDWAITSRRT